MARTSTDEKIVAKLFYYDDDPLIQENQVASMRGMPGNLEYLTDYYWRLYHEKRMEAGLAIAHIAVGTVRLYPELSGVGVIRNDDCFLRVNDETTIPFTSVGLIRSRDYRLLDPENTARSMVTQINANLSALDSPLVLELPQEGEG